MRNITGDIRNWGLKRVKGKMYYFDSNGICKSVPVKEATFLKYDNEFSLTYPYYFPIQNGIYFNVTLDNRQLIQMAISRLKDGDTLEDFDNFLSEAHFTKHEKPTELDRFITKIETPTFLRYPENLNKNTFDLIYVDVNVLSNWDEDRLTYIQKNIKKITSRVLTVIDDSKTFQKYGIPINFLKVSRLTLRRNNILEFVFELKLT